MKKKQRQMTDLERMHYELGFEDGYAVAKRLYKVIRITHTTQSDLDDRRNHPYKPTPKKPLK